MIAAEQFKAFPLNPLVQVGYNGTIIRPNGRKASLKPDNIGYLNISIFIDGKMKPFKQHRVIALTWIDNPLKLSDVNHKDGIKTNNTVNNLEWMSHKENIIHAHKSGLFTKHMGRVKGYTHSQETKDKMSKSKTGRHRIGMYGKWVDNDPRMIDKANRNMFGSF
jgi:HNH endonuclease/NUMOD3 motif